MKGLSAFPQISWLPTGIIWVSPLCVGACLWTAEEHGRVAILCPPSYFMGSCSSGLA